MVQPLLDPEKLEAEWPRLKEMIKGAYFKFNTSTLCKRSILLHCTLFPNCAKLASIALCMQLTSIDVSVAQNCLKNKFRASVGAEKLELLLRISIDEGDSNENRNKDSYYDKVISSSIVHWLKVKTEEKIAYLLRTDLDL